jgi:general secretion pathway protein C
MTGSMRRLVLRIANAALFVLCCFLLASVINQIAAELLLPVRNGPTVPTAQTARIQQPSWSERQPILDRNLFGARLAGEAEAEPEPEPVLEELEETKLPLKLLGTAAAIDGAGISKAAIEDTRTREHQVVRVGDALKNHGGVEVARIDRRRVVLRNGPRLEELSLDEEEQGPQANVRSVSARRPPVRAARARPTRSRAPAPLSERLQELRQQVGGGRDPAALFSQARILPKYENGEMVGVQVSSIQPDSFYEKLGIREGDVITELNGIRIDSAAASAQILAEFTEADEFQITVTGESGTRPIVVPPEQVAELLR